MRLRHASCENFRLVDVSQVFTGDGARFFCLLGNA